MYNNSIMTGYSIVYIFSGLIVGCIFGFVTKHINESKGYEGGFAWGFWLTILGVIVVACKPARQNISEESTNETEKNEEPVQERIKCADRFYKYNDFSIAKRQYQAILRENAYLLEESQIKEIGERIIACSKELGSAISCIDDSKDELIKCPNCGLMNKKSDKKCFACTRFLDEKYIPKNQKRVQETQSQKVSTGNEQIALIKQLAELHSQGIISDEEFETKKTELLARM